MTQGDYQPCKTLASYPCLVHQNGTTALIKGADKGHVAVVEILLAAGANKDLQNNVGRPQPSLLPTHDQEDDESNKTHPVEPPYPTDRKE